MDYEQFVKGDTPTGAVREDRGIKEGSPGGVSAVEKPSTP